MKRLKQAFEEVNEYLALGVLLMIMGMEGGQTILAFDPQAASAAARVTIVPMIAGVAIAVLPFVVYGSLSVTDTLGITEADAQ